MEKSTEVNGPAYALLTFVFLMGVFANAVNLILVFPPYGPPPRPGEAPALDARRLTTPRNGRPPGGMSGRAPGRVTRSKTGMKGCR